MALYIKAKHPATGRMYVLGPYWGKSDPEAESDIADLDEQGISWKWDTENTEQQMVATRRMKKRRVKTAGFEEAVKRVSHQTRSKEDEMYGPA